MKKIIFATSLAGILLIATGCGGSDDKKELTIDEISLDFSKKETASYDLSQYLAPDSNKTNTYIKKVYEDKSGKKSYSEDSMDESFPTVKFEVSTTTIKAIKSDDGNSTFSIGDDRVFASSFLSSGDKNLVRYIDAGDYISKTKSQNVISWCKLNRYLNSYKVSDKDYNDVIELKCKVEKSSSGTTGTGSEYSDKSIEDSLYLFSKNIGLIESTKEECTTTVLNENEDQKCEKVVKKITNII